MRAASSGRACSWGRCWEDRWAAWRIIFCRHTPPQPGAYALCGHGGAVRRGIVRAPMTSVVMIFETTRDYAVIVPLMIANLVSFFLSSRLQKEPIYEATGRAGWHPFAERVAQRRQGQRQVAQVMRPVRIGSAEEMPIGNAIEEARGKEFRTLFGRRRARTRRSREFGKDRASLSRRRKDETRARSRRPRRL